MTTGYNDGKKVLVSITVSLMEHIILNVSQSFLQNQGAVHAERICT